MRLTSVGRLSLAGIVACGCATTVLAQVDSAPQQMLAATSSPVHGTMPANGQGVQDNGGRRTVIASRLGDGESVALDGRLDEPFWSRAVPAADFIQIDPANGGAASEPTEVRVVFDQEALYLGVTCFDSEPDRWIGWQLRRDERLFSDDAFVWTIDTFLDGRTGYFFEMNPSGLIRGQYRIDDCRLHAGRLSARRVLPAVTTSITGATRLCVTRDRARSAAESAWH